MLDIAQRIKQEADKIRSRMTGGSLFGLPVDLKDTDSLIFAAYLLGQRDSEDRTMKEIALRESLETMALLRR
jgi:hypothetical protein